MWCMHAACACRHAHGTVDVDGSIWPNLSRVALMNKEKVIALSNEATRPRARPRCTTSSDQLACALSEIVSSSVHEPPVMLLIR